jgi:hypothetical protein
MDDQQCKVEQKEIRVSGLPISVFHSRIQFSFGHVTVR